MKFKDVTTDMNQDMKPSKDISVNGSEKIYEKNLSMKAGNGTSNNIRYKPGN